MLGVTSLKRRVGPFGDPSLYEENFDSKFLSRVLLLAARKAGSQSFISKVDAPVAVQVRGKGVEG